MLFSHPCWNAWCFGTGIVQWRCINCVGSLLIFKFRRNPTQTGKLEARLILFSLQLARIQIYTHKHTYSTYYIWEVNEITCQIGGFYVTSTALIFSTCNASKHTVNPALNAEFTIQIYDVKTLKPTLTHSSLFSPDLCAVRLYQRLSTAHVLHLNSHSERKSMTSHKNDPGRKFKCQTHTEICLKRGKKEGELWTSTRWLIS